jgi:hypothetical protein
MASLRATLDFEWSEMVSPTPHNVTRVYRVLPRGHKTRFSPEAKAAVALNSGNGRLNEWMSSSQLATARRMIGGYVLVCQGYIK